MRTQYDPPLTAEELAEQLGCEPAHVNLLASQRKLPAVKFGRSWRFPVAAISQYLNDLALNHVGASAGEVPPPPRPPGLPDLTKTVQVAPVPDKQRYRRRVSKRGKQKVVEPQLTPRSSNR